MRCKVDTLLSDVIVFIIEPHRSHGVLILCLDATLQSDCTVLTSRCYCNSLTRSCFVLLLLNYLSSLFVLSHSKSLTCDVPKFVWNIIGFILVLWGKCMWVIVIALHGISVFYVLWYRVHTITIDNNNDNYEHNLSKI